MKENNSIVIGYIKDSTSVLVEDGDGYYRINTMQIQVLKNIIDIEEKTITAVYACRYERNYGNVYKPAGTYRCTDSFGVKTDQFLEALFCTQAYVELQGKAAGFILLREATDQKLTLGNTSYNLSDYADYVLDACLAVDEYGGIVLRSTSGYCYAIYPHIVEEVFNRSFLFPPKTPQDSTHELTPDTITPEP